MTIKIWRYFKIFNWLLGTRYILCIRLRISRASNVAPYMWFTAFVSVLCKIDNIGVFRLLRSSSIEHMVDDCQTYLWLSFTEPSGDEWKWYLQDASNTNLREKEYMLYVAFDLLLYWFWWCVGVHSVEQFDTYLCFVKSADQNQN